MPLRVALAAVSGGVKPTAAGALSMSDEQQRKEMSHTLAETLRNLIPRLSAIAPVGTPVEDIVENTIYAIARDPELSKCSTGSIVEAVMEAIGMGLDPSGLSNDGTLIPRKTRSGGFRAVFVPDYRALLRIMLSHPRVSHVEARTVRKDDHFELRFGDPDGRVVDHRPAIRSDPGEALGAYAIAWFKDDHRPLVEWMTKAEVDANAERGGSFGSDNSPWETDWGEMARKTVIKRLAKYLAHKAKKAGTYGENAKGTPSQAPSNPDNTPHPSDMLGDLARQYRASIESAAPDGIDLVIQAIREDDRLDHMEKTELFNLACRRKKEIRKAYES